ncbi:hypothetical protein CDCA_CDCA11G3115 [Cyanidium caldarium]|uniref:Kinesin motor domain-containing protein n=1 Tax=Cyanidium caldarium TaxID=2771 RepID=A0AAV9IYC3_CYACA|nr:hypothetical protein CDCA_CDCA11G3115 [Cyanidium caldarium]
MDSDKRRSVDADAIKVAVRLRPLLEREKEVRGSQEAWRAVPHAAQVVRVNNTAAASSNSASSAFHFDVVFGKDAINQSVFDSIGRPIAQAAVAGFNGTVLAYGQTSSGKTHTMWGAEEDPGLTRRAVSEVFAGISSMQDREFLLRVSYVEIYNENIRDLLSGRGNSGGQSLRVQEDSDGRVTVVDVHEEVVTTAEQVFGLLLAGESRRMVGATDMNERSSRSHTVFTLTIESRQRVGDQDDAAGDADEHVDVTAGTAIRTATLTLVDLAGSERQRDAKSEGQRLKEGGYINKSLLTLGTVINKLADGAGGHIPYRDSKLTRILQNALGGNSRTAVVCAITPAAVHAEESLSTLKFASRAKQVKNRAQCNELLDDRALLLRYKKEIAELREQLDRVGHAPCSNIVDGQRLQELEVSAAQAAQEREAAQQRLQEEESRRRAYEHKLEKLTRLILNSPERRRLTRSRCMAEATTTPARVAALFTPGEAPQSSPSSGDIGASDDGNVASAERRAARAIRKSRRRTICATGDVSVGNAMAPLHHGERRVVRRVRHLVQKYEELNASVFELQMRAYREVAEERARADALEAQLEAQRGQRLHDSAALAVADMVGDAVARTATDQWEELRRALAAERERSHGLAASLQSAATDAQQHGRRMEALQTELQHVRAELEELRQRERAGFAQSQLRTLDQLRNKVSDLEAKLRSQLQARQELESARGTVDRELKRLERQNKALERELSKMQDQRDKLQAMRSAVAASERERDAAMEQSRALGARVNPLEAEVESLRPFRERCEAAETQYRELQQRVEVSERAASAAAEAQAQATHWQTEWQEASAQVAALEARLEESGRELQSLAEQATDAQYQLEASRAELRARQQAHAELEGRLRAEHQREQEAKAQLDALRREAAKHARERQRLVEGVHARDGRIADLERRLRELCEGGGRVAKLKRSLEKREHEARVARQALKRVEERLVALGQSETFCQVRSVSALEAERDALQQLADAKQDKVDSLEQDRALLIEENNKLRALIKDKDRVVLQWQARIRAVEAGLDEGQEGEEEKENRRREPAGSMTVVGCAKPPRMVRRPDDG